MRELSDGNQVNTHCQYDQLCHTGKKTKYRDKYIVCDTG